MNNAARQTDAFSFAGIICFCRGLILQMKSTVTIISVKRREQMTGGAGIFLISYQVMYFFVLSTTQS